MMLLNLSRKFLTLNGKESSEDMTMGQLLADCLAKIRGNINILKAKLWAEALYKNENIEIDKVDLLHLIQFVESLQNLTPLATWQLTEELNKLS